MLTGKKVFVELVDGRRVLHPDNMRALVLGEKYHVEKNQFWLRRIGDGDVRVCKEAKPVEKKVSASKKKKSRGEE